MIFLNHVTIYIKKRVIIGFLGDEKLDELFFFFILPFSEFLQLAYISCVYWKNKSYLIWPSHGLRGLVRKALKGEVLSWKAARHPQSFCADCWPPILTLQVLGVEESRAVPDSTQGPESPNSLVPSEIFHDSLQAPELVTSLKIIQLAKSVVLGGFIHSCLYTRSLRFLDGSRPTLRSEDIWLSTSPGQTSCCKVSKLKADAQVRLKSYGSWLVDCVPW